MISLLSGAAEIIQGPLVNHLWQSTLFAVVAGSLTLAFRNNRAQVRYGLWLAASLKFLVPFSLLTWIASHLAFQPVPPQPPRSLSLVMQQIAQPFPAPIAPSAAVPSASSGTGASLIPALLLVVWILGCLAVLFNWWLRWRRVAVALRNGVEVREGREAEALLRFRSNAAIRKQPRLLSSPMLFEPGVLGIWRPVLLWPAGISDGLTNEELEAIVGHEVCHARRYDNLASVVQMAVGTIFWFHPMVWWMGARLFDERERACDEEVLRLGCKPHVYAESILHVCKYCLQSPLLCVAGISGSSLKKRMESIMNYCPPRKLGLGRKLLLAAAGAAALTGVVMAGNYQFQDGFNGKLKPGWQWIDPQHNSWMSLDARPGFLRITVSGYHDLWPANNNFDAPRLMREVSGDFTIETELAGPSRWCGGLLIWKDQDNFVRFERGIHFKNNLSFSAASKGAFRSLAEDYAAGDPTWLRLTRRGSTVTAAYSFDGTQWLQLKRLWRVFGFKKQPPQIADGRSLLPEDDLIFVPGTSSTELNVEGPVLVGVDAVVPAIAPPVGLKQTVTDFYNFAITTP